MLTKPLPATTKSASVPTENDTDVTNTSLDADWFEQNNSLPKHGRHVRLKQNDLSIATDRFKNERTKAVQQRATHSILSVPSMSQALT